MKIDILGTESLGLRGLSCLVRTANRHILFDPGVSLGYKRHGLLPHPAQVAVGAGARSSIISALRGATDVVFSHFHGDHVPLVDANPYQMPARDVVDVLRHVRLWTKDLDGESDRIRGRIQSLFELLDRELRNAAGQHSGPLSFSAPVPHGQNGGSQGNVMMTRVQEAGDVFVHASDIQLLNETAVAQILRWKPKVVVVSGPPLYLDLPPGVRQRAWELALRLSRKVENLVIDHHLLRCLKGLSWIEKLSVRTSNRVMCAADFMERPRQLLEARRSELYEKYPVPERWHEDYRKGRAGLDQYRHLFAGRGKTHE